MPAEKIVVKPNFVQETEPVTIQRRGFALYVGRLSEEKGIRVLLSAWKNLGTILPLKIVGDGPMTAQVEEEARQQMGITLEGRQPKENVMEMMAQADFLIFPSECYETFGMTIIEAFSVGLPVIASDHGVMTAMVEDHRTGLRFTPGSAEELAKKVRYAVSHPDEITQMRAAARAEYLAQYTAERNYEMLMGIYQRVLKRT